MDENTSLFTKEHWKTTGDGFDMYFLPMADILEGMGIHHTGLSSRNHADVRSYYDDWYLYRVTREKTVYSLLKMREQEHDFVPGYADMDDPGVTISFVAFDLQRLMDLQQDAAGDTMAAFVHAFRCVTEYLNQPFDPELQRYFSDERAKAPYLIGEAYVDKLLTFVEQGRLPFPEKMKEAPRRLLMGLEKMNRQAGKQICDFENGCLRIDDPENPTREERLCLLAAHTGNLSQNSFAAEVKYHADALVSWQNKIPFLGKSQWYASALRADMQVEGEEWLRKNWFSPYYDEENPMILRQAEIHGER